MLNLGDPFQSHSEEIMSKIGAQSEEMVGERCKKEPAGDFEKWRSMPKVWEKLEEGGVTKYLMNLHGYD